MSHRVQNIRNGGLMRQAELNGLGNPLDFFAQDHMQEREICTILDQIAAGTLTDSDLATAALAFFQEVLPFHLADEEQDLFPLMIRRCEPEDGIEETITRLRNDHAQSREESQQVIAVLQAFLTDCTLPSEAENCDFLTSFTTHARRHLIVENAIILPIARARLSKDDLDKMLINMLKRRSLDRVIEVPDAE